MFQILGFWSSIEFGIINGIYSLVIKVYDIMEKILKNNAMDLSKFEGIATTMYVLAGVFILFKVVIAMVQMILNPDLVTDKQAGAGKLITRIVTSLIMLIAFAPNGFIFGYEGLFSRIEEAVIADDGLIDNIISVDLSTTDKKETEISNQSYNNNSNGGFFIENVYAATNVNCYYYRISSSEYNSEDADAHGNERYKITVDKIYKISYYYNPSETTISTEGLTKVKDTTNVYYKERSGIIGGSANCTSGNCAEYSHLGYPIKKAWASTAERTIKNGKCPGSLEWDKNDKTWKVRSYGATSLETGLRGGTSSLNDLKDKINTLSTSVGGFDSGGNSFVDESNGRSKPSGDYLFFTPVSENAILFGQATASSLQECAPSAQTDCIKAQKDMFETKSANKEIVNLIDEENLEISFIFAIITGIGLIIYLLFLCVEIIIRRFKLFFLEVLAPIPIISYVDPKDKTFNSWFKMYIATYLDLFIKLIAIKIAVDLVATISNAFWSTGNIDAGIIGGALIKFFYIVAILAFAKILPTMISKIFNLDSMGGSFKDIMGMAKGAAGFGAGAVLGAGAGLVSGFSAAAKAPGIKNKLLAGAGAIGSGMSGLAKGAGSGAKGNILGGAKDVSGRNANRRSLYAGGVTPGDLIAASTIGKIGMDKASRTDRKNLKDVERLAGLKKGDDFMQNIKEGAKGTKFFKSLRDYASDPNNNFRLTEKQWGDVEDAVASTHLMSADEEGKANQVLKDRLAAAGVSSDVLMAAWGNDNNMIDGKQRDIMRADAELYEEFINNSSDVQTLVKSGQYLTDKEKEFVASSASEDRFMRYKATDKSVKSESREINTRIEKSKLAPGYASSNAARNAGSNNKK